MGQASADQSLRSDATNSGRDDAGGGRWTYLKPSAGDPGIHSIPNGSPLAIAGKRTHPAFCIDLLKPVHFYQFDPSSVQPHTDLPA